MTYSLTSITRILCGYGQIDVDLEGVVYNDEDAHFCRQQLEAEIGLFFR